MTLTGATGSFPDPGGGDCVACGRCCHHGPRTVHLLDTDDERVLAVAGGVEILRRLTVVEPRPPGWRFMVNTGERCAALDVSRAGHYPCAIYAVRPDDCRIVEPGSPACMEARRLGHLGSSVEYERR
ncbi:MAG: YkgJ family cysteine cluster protein [Myxococcota bacterium]|nr:YkgJ family cysteine cluster protein [Myxococcota bacterium]